LVSITLNKQNLPKLEGKRADMFRATRKSLNLIIEFENEAECAKFYADVQKVVDEL